MVVKARITLYDLNPTMGTLSYYQPPVGPLAVTATLFRHRLISPLSALLTGIVFRERTLLVDLEPNDPTNRVPQPIAFCFPQRCGSLLAEKIRPRPRTSARRPLQLAALGYGPMRHHTGDTK